MAGVYLGNRQELVTTLSNSCILAWSNYFSSFFDFSSSSQSSFPILYHKQSHIGTLLQNLLSVISQANKIQIFVDKQKNELRKTIWKMSTQTILVSLRNSWDNLKQSASNYRLRWIINTQKLFPVFSLRQWRTNIIMVVTSFHYSWLRCRISLTHTCQDYTSHTIQTQTNLLWWWLRLPRLNIERRRRE